MTLSLKLQQHAERDARIYWRRMAGELLREIAKDFGLSVAGELLREIAKDFGLSVERVRLIVRSESGRRFDARGRFERARMISDGVPGLVVETLRAIDDYRLCRFAILPRFGGDRSPAIVRGLAAVRAQHDFWEAICKVDFR